MAYHFADDLQKSNIEKLAEKFGFRHPVQVEKFIMDFEVFRRISREADCVLRGGMCVPFHTELGVRRLSSDIDLFTGLPADEIGTIMGAIDENMKEVDIRPHKPANPLPIPNLQTYFVYYDSVFGKPESIKVDYLCDVPLRLPTNTARGQEITGFNMDYPAKILTRGALIGDKITAMAMGTIGLDRSEGLSDNIPKQVYDIATLLKSATKEDVAESFGVFASLTDFKAGIFDRRKYSVQEALDSICSSVPELLSTRYQITTAPEYDGLLGSFFDVYLNRLRQHGKSEHISDILLVQLYSVFLQKFFSNPASGGEVAERVFSAIGTYRRIADRDPDKKRLAREALLRDMPRLPFGRKALNQAPVENVFLIKEIFSD